MRECWLKPNRRPYLVVGIGVSALAVLAAGLCFPLIARGYWQAMIVSHLIAGFAIAGAVTCFRRLRRPRLAYEDGELLVFAGSSKPQCVPIDVVEVLFLGSGPALPVGDGQDEQRVPRAANVVVRLAESATDWHNRELPSAVDQWSDGYIVLSGTTCEPISHERLNIINHRLAEIRRERRSSQAKQPQATS